MFKASVAMMALFCACISTPLMAQTTDAPAEGSQAAPLAQDFVKPEKTNSPGLVSGFALDFLNDQKAIWTSPFHLNGGDVKWLAPVVVAGGTLAVFDHKISNAAKENPSLQGPSNAISNVGLIAPWAVPGAMWVVGGIKHNDHAAETGRLGIEAAVDSEVLMQVIKFATHRGRPNGEDYKSFPSGHSMEAFALASVLSGEYPDKKLVVFGSYGLATAVSLSRIGGLNHFPTDVLAGAVMGELLGRYIVHHHAAQQKQLAQ
jgi:membrane-associated phospholipid phosphatase